MCIKCFSGDWTPLLTFHPPPCFSVFLYSGLSSLLDGCGVQASVFPFNTVTVLYLLCTGPHNPYFPHHRVTPPWEPETNGTDLVAVEVM